MLSSSAADAFQNMDPSSGAAQQIETKETDGIVTKHMPCQGAGWDITDPHLDWSNHYKACLYLVSRAEWKSSNSVCR